MNTPNACSSPLCASGLCYHTICSEDISIGPRTILINGEESIRAILMMYVVFLTSTLTGSHSKYSQSQNHYSQIDLADLHSPESSAGILLEMQDRQRYFEARPGAAVSAEQVPRPVRPCRLLLLSRYNRATIDRGLTPCGATNEARSRRVGDAPLPVQN